MKIYFIYILECSDDSFYVGMTNNLQRRLSEHQEGKKPTCYTFNRLPVKLVWFESFSNSIDAIKFEKQLKGWSRRKKIALIEKNWANLIEYSKNYTQFHNYIGNGDRSSTSSD